jgi:hypothetical protein
VISFDICDVLRLEWIARWLKSEAMRVLRSAYLHRMMPGSARAHTILALLLWSGVTVFIFGIIIDLFR